MGLRVGVEEVNTVGERMEAREGACEGDAEGASVEHHAWIVSFA